MLYNIRGGNDKGFTLIELMIVVAIIGILSAIAIPNFLNYQRTGYDSAARAEAKNFYSIFLAYASDKGQTSNITLSATALPVGFSQNTDITYSGSLVVDTAGVTTSDMKFRHNSSATIFSLDANGALTNN